MASYKEFEPERWRNALRKRHRPMLDENLLHAAYKCSPEVQRGLCARLHHSEVAIIDLAAGESAVGVAWPNKLQRTQCAMPAWPKQPSVNHLHNAAIHCYACAPQPSKG